MKLVGRAKEREAIASALASIRERPGGIVSIEGEPGIGKSRLLVAAAEAAAGCTVLAARASEFEHDLPYALFAEALEGEELPLADRHETHRALRALLERLASARPLLLCLDDVHWADPASLDALAALARRPPAAPVLFAVAAREGQLPAPLAAALGAASRDGRLTRLALGPLGEAEAAELVGGAAAAVYRQAGGNPFYLEQLARFAAPDTRAAAAGSPAVTATTSTAASAGDPAVAATIPPAAAEPADSDAAIPPAVAAALAAELAALGPDARAMLDAAAVSGDPFDADLAAAVAELAEPAALRALDELTANALVRPGAAPRRFAFRHPVVRHAVYVATGGGWRLGAHARAARELERRGAGPVRRAHHVEHAAPPGDEAAVELLLSAARELHSPAPATAARFHAAALRLLPETPGHAARRARMQALLADAQAAAGDARAARATLVDALRTAPAERLALTVALANQEWWLGGHEQARRRLHVAFGDLPAEASPDRIRLRLALGLTALSACDLADALRHTSDARDDARAIGDPVFELAALSCGALATVADARPEGAERLDEASAALARLSDEQLATRLPAFWMHGRALRGLGRFDDALAALRRGAELAADTGRERIALIVRLESVAVLVELGRSAEAVAAAEDGVELARLEANPRMLLWALCAESSARLAAGDVGAALEHATEAASIDAPPDFQAAGQPGWSLGTALVAAGEPRRGLAALAGALGAAAPVNRTAAAAGGEAPVERPAASADAAPAVERTAAAAGDASATADGAPAVERTAAAAGNAAAGGAAPVERTAAPGAVDHLGGVPPVERPAAAADLAAAQLACGDVAGAERTVALGEAAAARAGTPWAAAVAGVARAAVLLARERPREAAAAASAAYAAAAGAPLTRARARLAEGSALAALGDRDAAVAALRDAERALDGFGALRLRDQAARELRRLGHRVTRPARDAAAGPLTAREAEIADLIAAGRTNREIAEQLVLSTRTIEAHLRNIYAKAGVRSRVELARAVERGTLS